MIRITWGVLIWEGDIHLATQPLQAHFLHHGSPLASPVGQLQISDRLKVIFLIVPSPYPLIRCMMSRENSGERKGHRTSWMGRVRGARKIGKIKEEGPPNHLKNPGDREKLILWMLKYQQIVEQWWVLYISASLDIVWQMFGKCATQKGILWDHRAPECIGQIIWQPNVMSCGNERNGRRNGSSISPSLSCFSLKKALQSR